MSQRRSRRAADMQYARQRTIIWRSSGGHLSLLALDNFGRRRMSL